MRNFALPKKKENEKKPTTTTIKKYINEMGNCVIYVVQGWHVSDAKVHLTDEIRAKCSRLTQKPFISLYEDKQYFVDFTEDVRRVWILLTFVHI